jgi:hypothetical protein
MAKEHRKPRRRETACLSAKQFAAARCAIDHLRCFADSLLAQQGPVREAVKLADGVTAFEALLAREIRCDVPSDYLKDYVKIVVNKQEEVSDER